MSWIEENALKRVFSVFKRFKAMKGKLWDNDIESLQTLSTAIENNSKAYVSDNILFAKLLAVVLRQEIRHFRDIKTGISSVAGMLKEPLDVHLTMLQLEINSNELNNYFESIKIDTDHFKGSKKQRELESITLTANQKGIIEQINKQYDSKAIEKSFYNSANDFLKDLDNYK
jgi:hypothetical protein